MNLEQLERFVMDTIDTYANNPKEYSIEGVKNIIADRFRIHRDFKPDLTLTQAIKELVESDLNQIPMNIDFRRSFYQITGFPAPEWFKDYMEADN